MNNALVSEITFKALYVIPDAADRRRREQISETIVDLQETKSYEAIVTSDNRIVLIPQVFLNFTTRLEKPVARAVLALFNKGIEPRSSGFHAAPSFGCWQIVVDGEFDRQLEMMAEDCGLVIQKRERRTDGTVMTDLYLSPQYAVEHFAEATARFDNFARRVGREYDSKRSFLARLWRKFFDDDKELLDATKEDCCLLANRSELQALMKRRELVFLWDCADSRSLFEPQISAEKQ